MQIVSALTMAKHIIESGVYDAAIDATYGNGNDTVLLSERSNIVYSFDIQKEAIEKNNNIKNVIYINDDHKNIAKYVDRTVDLVVFNLGYLPGGDKSITTTKDSTIEAIKVSMNLLNDNGKIIITSYSAHKGGEEEQIALIDFINKVDQSSFDTFLFSHQNGKNSPAKLMIIEKKMQVKKR